MVSNEQLKNKIKKIIISTVTIEGIKYLEKHLTKTCKSLPLKTKNDKRS